MANETQRDQSEFNMAFGFLNKINSLLWTCSESSLRLDAYTWFHALRSLTRTLTTELNEKQAEQIKEYINLINPLLQRHVLDTKKGKVRIESKLYDLLDNYEVLIMNVLKGAGLLLKMKESAEFALG